MKTAELSVRLGNETVHLHISVWGESKIVYVNLHENEQTSVEAGYEVLSGTNGILIELKSKGERLVSFTIGDVRYTFDPNRIFSTAGIRETLYEYGAYDIAAENNIAVLADTIIDAILAYNPTLIVALHNTTGEYCMDNYKEGGPLENDKVDIHVNPDRHNADLFFTTDRDAFDAIRGGDYNVVLQNNDSVTDDGSLSVYCAKNDLSYVNIEALNGHKKEQTEMIRFINNAFQAIGK